MNKKFIAITAVMMVLTGSMAFAANNASNTQMSMHQGQYVQQNASYAQHARHGQHMYQLSDRAKAKSSSMWDSVCSFLGMHGKHGSHEEHNGGRHM